MKPLASVLRIGSAGTRLDAARRVAALPTYQIALWPDGWEIGLGGEVCVRDTHEMAEARRWYRLAERNRPPGGESGAWRAGADRAMRMHGVFVPRAIVDMAERRFPTEQVASVAMQLVAGDWIKARRGHLLAAPERALTQRALAWCGSRHSGAPDATAVGRLVERLFEDCVAEGLLPRTTYRIGQCSDGGYGVRGCRCQVEADLDAETSARVEDVLITALIPWNRAIVRDGLPRPLIALRVLSRGAGRVSA